jgi:hypothetical protein
LLAGLTVLLLPEMPTSIDAKLKLDREKEGAKAPL